ncbi:hypothetical protein WS98_28980 [Burkholderia territorii]|uniref:Uncharacterized protein n=1 Tax=Burkholderia territorii TaxID=1503055 RepID=A0A104NMJ0_9BURK|nr:hypothetical protein [Burkholderia territorii]AOI65724.1 hypothetical protein WS51_19255 [Burkholderia territorii]KAB0662577.1 hypothetical protein F7R13_21350 [Burkholderia territorii]KUY87786.1 hypothetical protein WS47_22655 [Burkholderia territorii]KUZ09450.1 hypothetical protein WS50_20395 [Burkholderia territorii]KUZ40939.1 hypothetical protein WS52_12305 [Burkholderia territorii]
MTDAPNNLGSQDRLELLCWLTCGNLGAFYLNESWPDASFQVKAAHRWLDRHHRQCDWLAIAKLAALAQDIAKRHADFVDASWARDAVEEIVDTDDLDYRAKLVQWVYDDCCKALADKRLAD